MTSAVVFLLADGLYDIVELRFGRTSQAGPAMTEVGLVSKWSKV